MTFKASCTQSSFDIRPQQVKHGLGNTMELLLLKFAALRTCPTHETRQKQVLKKCTCKQSCVRSRVQSYSVLPLVSKSAGVAPHFKNLGGRDFSKIFSIPWKTLFCVLFALLALL